MSHIHSKRISALRMKSINKKHVSLIVVLLSTFGVLFLSGMVGGLAFGFSLFVKANDAVSNEDVHFGLQSQCSYAYSSDGVLLREFCGDERRDTVKYSEISDYIIDATVALEDKNFFEHDGVDLQGILRAAVLNASTTSTTGASTITQQLAKLLYLFDRREEKTIDRKLLELAYALKLEEKYSKQEILEQYLNEINYGNNIYGIETAAKKYFGTTAKNLTLAQASSLAGIPQSPTYNNFFSGATRDLEKELFVNLEGYKTPLLREYFVSLEEKNDLTNYFSESSENWLHSQYIAFSRMDGNSRVIDRWKQRQIKTLSLMMREGYISLSEADEAVNEDIFPETIISDMKAPHFSIYLEQLLVEKYGEEKLRNGGLRIYTTINYDLQLEAERIVSEQIADIKDTFNASNGALLSVDPRSGAILAYVGSVDYFDIENKGTFDVVRSNNRQPGSSFKPFEYAAMLQMGYTPETMLMDVRTNFGGGYTPRNYDGRFHGPQTIRQSLSNSFNIPAIKATAVVSWEGVRDFAYRMGVSSLSSDRDYGLSIGLGGAEVSMYDMVQGYTTFANMGKLISLNPILKITDANGQILEEFTQPEGDQVLEQGVAYMINDILSDNVARSSAFGSYSDLVVSRRAAAKTGTTNDIKDNWTIGYTPNIVTAVWVGNNSGEPLSGHASGLTGAAPIWNAFMEQAFLRIDDIPWYEFPNDLTRIDVDDISGFLPNEFADNHTKSTMILKSKLQNYPVDSYRIKLEIDTQNGLLANPITPDEFKEEKEFFDIKPIISETHPAYGLWLTGIEKWYEDERNNEGAAFPYLLGVIPTEVSPSYYNENNAPEILFIGIDDNDLVQSNNLAITWKALSPFPINSVKLYLEDTLQKEYTEQLESYSHTLSLHDGEYDIMVEVTDENGKTGSETIHITVDSRYYVSITSPENNIESKENNIDVKIKYNVPNGIKNVIYSVNDSPVKTLTSEPFDTTLSLEEGSSTITVTITDELGKTETDSIFILIDTSKPTIDSVTDDCNGIAVGSSCTIDASASDVGVGVKSLVLYIITPDGDESVAQASPNGTLSYTFNATSSGDWNYYLVATDNFEYTRNGSIESFSIL